MEDRILGNLEAAQNLAYSAYPIPTPFFYPSGMPLLLGRGFTIDTAPIAAYLGSDDKLLL